MSRWYRAYEGTTTDWKLAEAALVADAQRAVVIATWHAILESCAGTQDGGRFTITPRRVAAALGEKPELIEAVFAALADVGVIEGDGVVAWGKRQFASDSSTERVRKHRETQCNGGNPLPKRILSVSVSGSEAQSQQKEAPRAREEDFERLVAACPKRKGSNPHKQARERFGRLVRDGHDPEQIIAAAARWRAREVESGNDGTKFVPMLSVWLNREEWTEKQPAPFVAPTPQGVFVEHESGAWVEWTYWHRQHGKLMPPPVHRLNGKEGRYMPSLTPDSRAA